MSSRILFFGNERLATGLSTTAPVLQALIAAGYEVAAIVVAQDEVGPSRKGRALEIAALAEQHDIPVLALDKPAEAITELAAYQAEAAILIAYGKLIPQEVIDIFPHGIINLHPSLLPKHRGSIPIESVILNGDSETGVSLMALASEMDAGPIYAQAKLPLNGNETKQALTASLLELGKDLIIQSLPGILDGSLQPQAQSDTDATYDERIQKQDSVIDWQKTAARVEREVRAYLDWPRSRTKLSGIDVIITAAHVENGSGAPGSLYLEDRQLGVHCGENILIIDSLIPAGKKEMPAQAFLAGYKLS